MKTGYKWLIVEVVSIGIVVLGACLSGPHLSQVSAGILLALIVGTFGAGYAASRLDMLTRTPKIRSQVSRENGMPETG